MASSRLVGSRARLASASSLRVVAGLVVAGVLVAGCSTNYDELFGESTGSGGSTGVANGGGTPTSTGSGGGDGGAPSSTTTGVTTTVTSTVAGVMCGDGEQNGQEECDGADLDGADCTDAGYVKPDGVTCTAACVLDYGGCVAECGNGGSPEPGEECDDGNANDGDGCSAACAIQGTTCQNAIEISLGLGETLYDGSTYNGTTSQFEPIGDGCDDGSGPERVFAVTPTTGGFLTAWIPKSVTDFDSVLYARADCEDAASEVLCNDNFGGNNEGGEVVSFPVEAGDTYFVFVDGYNTSEGDFQVSFDLSIGDDCSDPVPIRVEGSGALGLLGSTSGFTPDVVAGTPCLNNGSGPDVVYAVTESLSSASATELFVGATFNSVLHARTACTGSQINDVLTQVGCNNGSGSDSEISVLLGAAPTYVWVDGTSGQMGNYGLRVGGN